MQERRRDKVFMAKVWRVLQAALRDLWEEMLTAVLCNLLWVILNLLLITGPPATVAMFYVANRLAHDETADLRDFFIALRRYFGPSWRWGLVNGVMLFLLIGDVVLTGRLNRSQSVGGQWRRGFLSLDWLSGCFCNCT